MTLILISSKTENQNLVCLTEGVIKMMKKILNWHEEDCVEKTENVFGAVFAIASVLGLTYLYMTIL
jgi:hypothetical protein